MYVLGSTASETLKTFTTIIHKILSLRDTFTEHAITLVLPASCLSLLPGVAHILTNHTHRFGSTGGLAVFPCEKLLLAAGYDMDKGNANITGTSISWHCMFEGLASPHFHVVKCQRKATESWVGGPRNVAGSDL